MDDISCLPYTSNISMNCLHIGSLFFAHDDNVEQYCEYYFAILINATYKTRQNQIPLVNVVVFNRMDKT